MNKALIVGLGFGKVLYQPILSRLGYNVITVDNNLSGDFSSIKDAVSSYGFFDIVHICTPNFTHETLAREAAPYSKILFIEKPGLINHFAWDKLIKDHDCRIMMVKNNQYREEIEFFKSMVNRSKKIHISWNNKNRIPNPGSWFTDKKKSFGGVSKDLMPHMLSYFTVLTDYQKSKKISTLFSQNHKLDSIESTDYGIVNKKGVYDVDDFCQIEFIDTENKNWILTCNWKTDINDDNSIYFFLDKEVINHKLGLCPEEAYERMIASALDNLHNENFWKLQNEQDIWIHKQIEMI